MNESAGEQFVNYLDTHSALNLDECFESENDTDEPAAPPQREGLPRGFRMRHDAHYVDELMSRPARPPASVDLRERSTRTDTAAVTVDREAPSTVTPSADTGGAALDLVAAQTEAAVAHATVLEARGAGPEAAEFMRVEFARIARLARAAATLQAEVAPVRRRVGAGDIAAALEAAAAPILLAAGFEGEVTAEDPRFTVAGERALILQSVVQVLDAVVELASLDVDGPRSAEREIRPRISVTLRCVKPRPALIVEVASPSLCVPDHPADRFFDNQDADFRAAPAAGLLVSSAAHVARAHGGRAEMKIHPHRGATIALVFPQA